jgi:molybdate transport system substrate-binding protein
VKPDWKSLCLALLILGMGGPSAARADTLLVAVASNFTTTLEDIAARFEAQTGHDVRITAASTGVHYAQIVNGAPFDIVLSADAERPRLLEEGDYGIEGTRFTYASGRLVLWSTDPALVDGEGTVLESGQFQRLAVANPDTAPYGLAAQQVLEALGLLPAVASRLVTGTNITQTHQFVASGAASLGLVALAQVAAPGVEVRGSYWIVPETLYQPIEQQALLLKDTEAGRAFMTFLASAEIRQLIRSYGYGVPEAGSP